MKKCACLVASLVAQTVKNLPAMWEIWIQFLGWGDPLEESMATHSSILAWRIPNGQRSLVGYSLWGRKESDMTERLHFSLSLYTYIVRDTKIGRAHV